MYIYLNFEVINNKNEYSMTESDNQNVKGFCPFTNNNQPYTQSLFYLRILYIFIALRETRNCTLWCLRQNIKIDNNI